MTETTDRLGLLALDETGDDHPVAYREAINEHAATLDALNPGAGDFLQAGVPSEDDWGGFELEMENPLTGTMRTIKSLKQVVGGVAWLTDPVLPRALMRTVTPKEELRTLTPPTLPAAGKFISIGLQLAPTRWGASATLSLVSGAPQATEAAALAAPAGEVAGKTRIVDVIIKNNAGKYEVLAERDRRPWAQGARSERTGTGLTPVAEHTTIPETQQRLEISGLRPVRVTIRGIVKLKDLNKGVFPGVKWDSHFAGTILDFPAITTGVALSSTEQRPYSYSRVLAPTSGGSVLFTPYCSPVTGENNVEFGSPTVMIEEVAASANNGTA